MEGPRDSQAILYAEWTGQSYTVNQNNLFTQMGVINIKNNVHKKNVFINCSSLSKK